MYLDVAERYIELIEHVTEEVACYKKWENFPYSQLLHHNEACCDIAHEWLVAMDFARLNGGDIMSGPRWMQEKYEWGPSVWPLHWCEVVGRKSIDCGAHAALAHEAFTARGVTAFRAQFVQRYSPEAISQWRLKWDEGEACDHWLEDDFIYHEGNAMVVGGSEIKLWDPSAGWWLNPRQTGGYGSLGAVRVFTGGHQQPLRWGEHRIAPDQWHII
ncbi:MAG TPA: hypothetical protein VF681_10535 [Abditibacteriaceae bacterium]|jgi:hypothetical protein